MLGDGSRPPASGLTWPNRSMVLSSQEVFSVWKNMYVSNWNSTETSWDFEGRLPQSSGILLTWGLIMPLQAFGFPSWESPDELTANCTSAISALEIALTLSSDFQCCFSWACVIFQVCDSRCYICRKAVSHQGLWKGTRVPYLGSWMLSQPSVCCRDAPVIIFWALG